LLREFHQIICPRYAMEYILQSAVMNSNQNKSLVIYFVILSALCFGFIFGAKALGQKGAFLAQGYMLTPAIAAILTRLFFYPLKFKDANLTVGKFRDYAKFWVISLGITMLSYVFFTAFGAITWDFSGEVFIARLTGQFAAAGQNIHDNLPQGFTPKTMLMLFFIGGLTFLNILPGMITGFGEEFGHRGFMFPLLYKIRPWVGLFIGGLIWYAWHLPLALVIPKTVDYPLWQDICNFFILGIGGVCTFIYLSYVYVKSKSVFVTSISHIVMNNSAASFSYFAIIQNQVLANAALCLTMLIVVAILYYKKGFEKFGEYFRTSDV